MTHTITCYGCGIKFTCYEPRLYCTTKCKEDNASVLYKWIRKKLQQ